MDGAKKRSEIVDRTGQQWGQYRIIKSLEQGRFAHAYLAEINPQGQGVIQGAASDRSRQLAIDILPMPLTKDNADIFLQQARRLIPLVHPHILRLIDAGVENFVPFIIMEYVSHIPLRQMYKSEGQPLDKLLPYLKLAVTALQYAHDQGILHKNLRPDTILIGWSSGPLLCDFAIDVINENDQYQNYWRARDTVDSLAYIAPEQIQRHVSKASDQYSLAAMIYEWLCGAPLFQGTHFELANHHLRTTPTPLRQRDQSISPAVEEVILTALTKDPTRRFGSVTAFFNALSQAHDPKAALLPIPTNRPVPPTPTASPPVPVIAQAYAPPANPVPAELPVTPTPVMVNTPRPIPTELEAHRGISPDPYSTRNQDPRAAMDGRNININQDPRAAMDGRNISINQDPRAAMEMMKSATPVAINQNSSSAGSPPPKRPKKPGLSTRRAFVVAIAGLALVGGGGGWLFWKRLHPDQPIPLPPPEDINTPSPGQKQQRPVLIYQGHQGRVNSVMWSPDGQLIASASDDKTVQVYDSTTGKINLTYNGHKDHVNTVAWSPDGQLIASAGADRTVQVWEAATGNLVATYHGHTDAVNSVSWSKSGRLIASGSDDHTVHAWAVQDLSLLLRYREHKAAVSSVAWAPDGTKIASGSWDQTVQVISTVETDAFAVGDQIFLYGGHSAEVYAVSWAPNGKRLASAGGDNVVQVCNGITGANVDYPPRRHQKPVRTVAWSPDISHIASAGDDQTIRLWDSNNGNNINTFVRGDAILAVAWSPDSHFVATAGTDKTVQIFAL